MTNLTPEQQKVTEHIENPSLVLAAAGSGKSTTLLARASKLIKEHNVPPSEILISTFSRKSIDDLIARASIDPILSQVNIKTLHSVGFKAFRDRCQESQFMGKLSKHLGLKNIRPMTFPKLIKSPAQAYLLAEQSISNWDKKEQQSIDIAYSLQILSRIKRELLTFSEDSHDNLREYLQKEHDFNNHQILQFIKVGKAYMTHYLTEKYIDFDDMLYLSTPFISDLDRKFEYIMIDEAQDSNNLQYTLVNNLLRNRNLMLCGDDFQCQPEGNKVKMSDGSEKDISEVKEGDSVYTWARQGQHIHRNLNGRRKVSAVASRPFTGNLLTIKTEDGKISTCTPEHRWIARWTERDRNLQVTYLMRKGDKFRIGRCQLFSPSNKTSSNHLHTRTRHEEADAVWILTVHDNIKDASIMESYISTQFGLTQVMFKQINGNLCYTQERLDWLFATLDPQEQLERAIQCLKAHGRDIRFPWFEPNKGYRLRTTCFELQACNFISGHMSIPVYNGERTPDWSRITVESEYVENLPVYSLKVDEHETYISNGQITHNSIYSFTGAIPEQTILKFPENFPDGTVYKLSVNFRCSDSIVKTSEHISKHMPNPFGKEVKTGRKDLTVSSQTKIFPETGKDEATQVIQDILSKTTLEQTDGLRFRDIAIIYRINSQSRLLEDALLKAKLPYKIHGGVSFYNRKDVKDILALIMITFDPHCSDTALARIINMASKSFPTRTRFLGKTFMDQMIARGINRGGAFTAIISHHSHKPFQQKGIADLTQSIQRNKAETISQTINNVLEDIYIPFRTHGTNKEQILDEDDSFSNVVEELKAVAKEYGDDTDFEKFFEYILNIQKQLDSNLDDEDYNAINLMTYHKSKGLEFDTVYLTGLYNTMMPFIFQAQAQDGKDLHDKKFEPNPEERRLFYVGVTRAKNNLTYSIPKIDRKGNKAYPSIYLPEGQIMSQEEIETFLEDTEQNLIEDPTESFILDDIELLSKTLSEAKETIIP